MKLNIEELAKEAGAEDSKDWKGRLSYTFHESELLPFARLIVERCAVECEDLDTGQNLQSDDAVFECASAIRKLLEDE